MIRNLRLNIHTGLLLVVALALFCNAALLFFARPVETARNLAAEKPVFLWLVLAALLLDSALVWRMSRRPSLTSGPPGERPAPPPGNGHLGAIGDQLKFLQTLLDAIPNPVFYKDADGAYLGCNRAFEAYLGRPREGLVGNSVFDLAPPELAAIYHQADRELFAGRAEQSYEAAVQYADGSRHAVVFSKAPFFNADGSLGGLIGSFTDITEHKRVEAALKEQKDFADSLLRNSGAPTFVLDARHRVLAWNLACEELTGKTAADLLGSSNHWQAFYPEPHPCLADLILNPALLASQADWGYQRLQPSELVEGGLQAEGWYPDLHGRACYIFFNAAPIRNSAGEMIAVIETLEDISDRQKHQQETELFAQITTALRPARNRREIQTIVLDSALELSHARTAALLFHDPASDQLVVEEGRGQWAVAAGLRLAAGEGLARGAMESHRHQLHHIDLQDPRFADPALLTGLSHVACIPLFTHDQPVGVLSLGFSTAVNDQELRQLTIIGEIAAGALHRSILHEQTERQLQRLLALRNIDLAITSSLDLRLTLQVLLEQVRGQLQVDAADVFLCRPDQGGLDFAGGLGFRQPQELIQPVRSSRPWLARVPTARQFLTTAELAGREEAASAFGAEPEGFVFGAVVPLISHGQVQGVLEVFHRTPLVPLPEWSEFLEALGIQAAIAIYKASLFNSLQQSNARLVLAYDTTIEGWSRALDLRDRETEGHSVRVTEMALHLARAMGFAEDQLVHIRRGALLHDIGKMGIPDRILLKQGALTPEEWEIMHQHPNFSYQLLSPIEHLRPALDIPYCHHEKWNGSGYPRGLKGEQIPLAARIFTVVDVWDALRSDRPYRAGWPPERVQAYLREQAGSHFDPAVVATFLALDLSVFELR